MNEDEAQATASIISRLMRQERHNVVVTPVASGYDPEGNAQWRVEVYTREQWYAMVERERRIRYTEQEAMMSNLQRTLSAFPAKRPTRS